MQLENNFLESVISRFESYKTMGDKTLAQLSEEECFYRQSAAVNSVAIIIRHMHGNMLSRWTNFLMEDGEKSWRNRDTEFADFRCTKKELVAMWDEGWNCLLDTLKNLHSEDLGKEITIRTEPLKVYDAILRQLMHYSYHVGQIVLLGKILKDASWQSLSIPVGKSNEFNTQMGMK
ncbi:hypothetical protein A9P82_03650 [Arachidicoccus ginsenosidimutans]|uniref:DUF1572 family protein n=1 Tax=Arachidicoccus sp. BS20 TaxID=1850526 RepID=UPI0007F09E76|nr:DUF1572 family protein [Arachidicoccus sp. BS20]ANI88472.1 hypothetical protein A9P82_03650 [Arachidicoccus sp. BS20]